MTAPPPRRYASNMLDAKLLEATRAAQFQALADPVRLQIVAALSRRPHCVCEIQSAIGPIAANLLSYHLAILRGAGLVSAQRRGRWLDYRLELAALAALRDSLPGTVAVLDAATTAEDACGCGTGRRSPRRTGVPTGATSRRAKKRA